MGQTLSRSEAREIAFRMVFAGGCGDDFLEAALDGRKACEPEIKFINKICETVKQKQAEIDEKISAHLKDWTIDRISKTDLAALRTAAAEIIINEVPRAVIVNECVAVAKKYGDERSGAFVNGVLAKFAG